MYKLVVEIVIVEVDGGRWYCRCFDPVGVGCDCVAGYCGLFGYVGCWRLLWFLPLLFSTRAKFHTTTPSQHARPRRNPARAYKHVDLYCRVLSASALRLYDIIQSSCQRDCTHVPGSGDRGLG